MVEIRKKSAMWYLFRAPVYLYRWHLGWMLGHRLLLLTHIGRRTGLRRQTVLEVVELRSAEFQDHNVKAWFCLSRRRTTPA